MYETLTTPVADGGEGVDKKEAVRRIAAELEISETMVYMSLPYNRTVYDLENKTSNAKRCDRWRERQSQTPDQPEAVYSEDIMGRLKVLEQSCLSAVDVTQERLLTLLKENAETEFGKKHEFSEICTVYDYKRKVPFSVFDDYAASVDRMMRGEKHVLTAYPISFYAHTSGTLGKAKDIPFSEKAEGLVRDHASVSGEAYAEYLSGIQHAVDCLKKSEGYMSLNGVPVRIIVLLPQGICCSWRPIWTVNLIQSRKCRACWTKDCQKFRSIMHSTDRTGSLDRWSLFSSSLRLLLCIATFRYGTGQVQIS